jgi:hypothetical protein
MESLMFKLLLKNLEHLETPVPSYTGQWKSQML